MTVKILIADDHALFREGVCQFLVSRDAQIELLEAGNTEEALLLDLNMPVP